MSIRIKNEPREKYFGKLTASEATHAISILSHTGLKTWVRCAAHYDGYVWKFPDLTPEEIMELSEKGFLKRSNGINEDWLFDSAGGFDVKAHPSPSTGPTQSYDAPPPHTDADAPSEDVCGTFYELADIDDEPPF